ncbi:uncharacterized protein LOC121402096 [Xenopus laevis]|nr:uncharacterized protein LOC121400027 [Xenopus laevis]XP_041443893.1 uncharacterized protein LOC121402096 [Xenopus laevis]
MDKEVRGTKADIGALTPQQFDLYKKSKYLPPTSFHPVETVISLMSRDINQFIQDPKGLRNMRYNNNLTQIERESLKVLMGDKDVIYKPADKGGALVILDREYYIQEILSQLSNRDTYIQLDKDPTDEITGLISEVLSRYHEQGVVTDSLKDYLTKEFPCIPVLYTLPKIHKNLQSPPGRPIVAGVNSVLSPLSIFLDKVLAPFVQCDLKCCVLSA